MKYGFIKVAACTPKIKVADVDFNKDKILEQIKECNDNNVKVAVFPELCITGYTCQDLFFQDTLLDKAMEAFVSIANAVKNYDMLIAVGLPVKAKGKLFNCAGVINRGKILCFVPKTHLPNYNEFYEARHFTPYSSDECTWINLSKFDCELDRAPMEQRVFKCESVPELIVGFEICEDLWVADPVSNYLAKAGATLICK